MAASKKAKGAFFEQIAPIATNFIAGEETFSPRPVWDVKQWSWGYGTRVPGSTNDPGKNPGGSITKAQAAIDMQKIVGEHYRYLNRILTRPLNANQWSAWLSFSYNLGTGNADNLIANINKRADTALFTQMRKYINAGGSPSEGLRRRREKEIALWQDS